MTISSGMRKSSKNDSDNENVQKCITAEQEAKEHKKGLWSDITVAEIEKTLETIKSETEQETESGSDILKDIKKKLKKAKAEEED